MEQKELAFDKEANYDGYVVPDLDLADLDPDAIAFYRERFRSMNLTALLRSRNVYIDSDKRSEVTVAGHLLFGRVPPIWSYVRYLRCDGATVETGTRSNLPKDVRIDGTIPLLIEQTKSLLDDELRVIRLTESGRFERVLSLPEFARLEAVVNAVTQRSYSLQGDGVRIRHFTDRLEIESPGRLPGLVRVQNIRTARLSRNPHVARVLTEMTDYVRESNRVWRECLRKCNSTASVIPNTTFKTQVCEWRYTRSHPE